MSIDLDNIVPWGRSLREYELMFNLTPPDYERRILDCGGGPSSFSAELNGNGGDVRSIDPLYQYTGMQIQQRFHESLDGVIDQVDRTPQNWVWSYHQSSAQLRENRIAVMQRFLRDYDCGRTAGRYITAALPALPFRGRHFDLALCSHLLFLYSDLLSFEFHLAAIKEILRGADELRIFPLLTLKSVFSPYVEPLSVTLQGEGWEVTIERVEYELQRGGNQMMRIVRAQHGSLHA
jgi:hypothetical protein